MNSIKKLSALALSGALLLNGCASGGGQPQWINTVSEQFPAEKYLTASASADERNSADSRALANLARTFEVAIEDNAMDFSQATINGQGDQRLVSNEQRAARSVNTFANQVLEGAQVVEHWRGETAPYYSLAAIEKAPAARRFREKIRDLDKQTNDLRDYAANQASNPAAGLTALDKARRLQIEREQLNRNLAVLMGAGIPARNSAASLEAQIREALAVLKFDINAAPDELTKGLQAAVAALGSQVSTSSAYVIKGKMDTEPLQKKQGWYWLRGSLDLSLLKNNEAQANQRWPVKVSATDKGMVAQRAKDQLADKLPNYLYQLLTSEKIAL